MALTAECPRCPTPLTPTSDGGWACPVHGEVAPLWRAGPSEDGASYDDFAVHLELAGEVPTYLPWPLSPGWRITDFGTVSGAATYTCVTGPTDDDGPVDLIVVTEEPGTGVGARCAGTVGDDPGLELGDGPAPLKVRLEGQLVAMWPVSVWDNGDGWDRTVLAGEGEGRWLWLVIRPASALLLLRGPWPLRDVSALGPALLELPFGGPAPSW